MLRLPGPWHLSLLLPWDWTNSSAEQISDTRPIPYGHGITPRKFQALGVSTESPWNLKFSIHPPSSGRNHTVVTVQNSANRATDSQCFSNLFSWPKHNFSALACMGVWLLKVSERKTDIHLWLGVCSHRDGDRSSDTCYLVTCLDSTRTASASFPVATASAARCTPRSIFACLSSERISRSFLSNPPRNHFHTLKECIALFI